MTTWLRVSGLSGYYESNPELLSLDGDGVISKVSWNSYEPEGTAVIIYTSISRNGGYDWTDWRRCSNGGFIPDVKTDEPFGDTQLRFRVFLESNDPSKSPRLDEITFEFEPVIVFNNKGDVYCQPEIWITMNENGDFSIINISNENSEFKFTNLMIGETVYVNNERQHIETDKPATYRYSNFNDNYLNFPIGKNILRVNGKAKVLFRYQFKFI